MGTIKGVDIFKPVASILACQLAGVIGSAFTAPSIATWYATLKKPSFTPPNWVFTPVWITLFVMMGVALFIVWGRSLNDIRVARALELFGIQLILNILWSILFFGLRLPLAGLIEIGVLWIAIALTIAQFYTISRAAALLLVPYILWASFAAVLNASIWKLNA